MLPGGTIVAAVLAAAASPAQPVTPPAPESPTTQAVVGVVGAVLGTCLVSRERGVMIADLPAADRSNVHPASPEERKISPDKASSAWTTAALGGHMVISEPSANRCNVTADQVPVETAGQSCVMIALLAQHLPTPLVLQPTNLAHDPVVCQLEGAAGGQRFVVHLESAQPGGVGDAAISSHLQASVVRELADAKPLSK